MLKLKEEFDYLIVDTDEWLQDRAEEVPTLSEAAQEWQQADSTPYPQRMLDWVKETFPTATGIYGDGGPFDGCTYNEENFLTTISCIRTSLCHLPWRIMTTTISTVAKRIW